MLLLIGIALKHIAISWPVKNADQVMAGPLRLDSGLSVPRWVEVIFTLALLQSVALYGCGLMNQLTPEAAHRNYLVTLHAMVGKNIDSSQSVMVRPDLRLSEATLPNGLIRYRYGKPKFCVDVFDVDPRTRTIIDVTFEGDTVQCSIPP